MSNFNHYDPGHPVQHSWATAVRYMSAAPAQLRDGGDVLDASGWKVARLTDPYLGHFAGYAFGTYDLNAKATCAKGREHSSPHNGCDCGFYAWKDRSRALYLMERWRSTILLKVELYGEIIEHSDGFRAHEQEVVSMAVPGRCARGWCRGKTEGMTEGRSFWRSACSAHLKGKTITINEMRAAMALDIVLLED